MNQDNTHCGASRDNVPAVKDNSFAALVGVVSIITVALAWGWLRQTPSLEELYSDSGRFLYEFKTLFLGGELKWWTTNFMQGGSSATYFAVSFFLAISLIFEQVFGSPAGLKLLGLLTIPSAAFAAYAFVRKLTANGWTAFIAGLLYALNAQILLRIANFEHVASAVAYIFVPLILLCFIKVAEDGSWRSSALLGFVWSALMLTYAKLAFMFLPLALVFYVWLMREFPSRRTVLVRGTFVALVLVFLMSIVLLLPLKREYEWVAAFSFDNFAGWQQAFSMKNFISVLDRANGLLAQMRPDFIADRGQFYLGLVTLFSVGAVFWWSRKHAEWLATRNGV
ncbi:MAG: hypothetical protein ACO3G9_06680, partial [Chthoniobacterales bacterium]